MVLVVVQVLQDELQGLHLPDCSTKPAGQVEQVKAVEQVAHSSIQAVH